MITAEGNIPSAVIVSGSFYSGSGSGSDSGFGYYSACYSGFDSYSGYS